MDGPPRRESGRNKVIAMALALFTMALATAVLVTARPQEAQAQEIPEIAVLTGTCEAEQSMFHVEMVNPRETTFDFEYQLSAFGFGGGAGAETSLEPGATFSHDFPAEATPQTEWRVYFADADAGYSLVGQSNAVTDPCGEVSTTDESTTDGTTTDESTTEESTTEESTSEESTTEESTETSTDDFDFPVVTTTTDPGAIDPVSSNGSGGGLAQTGVAVVVLLGGAAVLLFNGIGLTRITRRGWATEDES
jgi:hypothetical protein